MLSCLGFPGCVAAQQADTSLLHWSAAKTARAEPHAPAPQVGLGVGAKPNSCNLDMASGALPRC